MQSGEVVEQWDYDASGKPVQKVKNPKRTVMPSHSYFIPTLEEINTRFADQPSWLTTALDIAKKCDVSIDMSSKHYPRYAIEGQQISSIDYLRQLCEENIDSKYPDDHLKKLSKQFKTDKPIELVRGRLERELKVIGDKGLADYLLIVWDFIHWARKNGIPVGPGRGSAVGSVICFLIGITNIEPIRFNLFFERFINPERTAYPDIDVDICMIGRPRLIAYMINKYGQECVAQIITFGKMKAKMAIRDVGRVLSVPFAEVNRIVKLIPDDLNLTIEKALQDPDIHQLCSTNAETRQLFEQAQILEGSIRNTGIHAAGLIVSEQPLTELVPVCVSKDDDMLVTQFSMKPVEAVGMLKIDFLGLKTLSSIQTAVDIIKDNHNIDLDWENLPLDDKKTFQMLNLGYTLGVFQLESPGMQDLVKKLKMDRFEEMIAVVALYRPGPMEMIPSYIKRKHGDEKIEYDHPLMETILKETYGIMVYQEQVMQIAQNLASYSLAEGDVLRKAMGKKQLEEMAKQKEKFVNGAVENGIDSDVATSIFEKMEKFAQYGFNKSHAAAYGYIAYTTAYLKAHYPKEWTAALMTCDKDDLSKVSKYIFDARSMNIIVQGPNINESERSFSTTEKGICFGLSAVKGVGDNVAEEICKQRDRKGPYKNINDFLDRVNQRVVGKKMTEVLIEAGAFDFMKWRRSEILTYVDQQFESILKNKEEKSQGVQHLFANKKSNVLTPPKVINSKDKSYFLSKKKSSSVFT